MLVKISNCGETTLLSIPENVCWRIDVNSVAPNGSAFISLDIVVDQKSYCVDTEDSYCFGRENFPDYAVEELYNDIIDKIFDYLKKSDIENVCLDMDDFINLAVSEHQKEWEEKGYITVDEKTGNW